MVGGIPFLLFRFQPAFNLIASPILLHSSYLIAVTALFTTAAHIIVTKPLLLCLTRGNLLDKPGAGLIGMCRVVSKK